MSAKAFSFKILAECPVSKARVAQMCLPHQSVDTPVFMPVGTQGTLKGLTSQQLLDLDCQIMLGNTYHLGNRPVRCAHVLYITSNMPTIPSPGNDWICPGIHSLHLGVANDYICLQHCSSLILLNW